MKRFVLFFLTSLITTCFCKAQNVFDPDDPIVRYDKNQPLGSARNPDPSVPGLQKWVSTPTIGVSTGTATFDASSFKQYLINVNGQPVAFRIKFPYSYKNPDSINKKYPVNLFLHGGGEVGCPTNGGIYNNEKQLWLGGELFRDRVNNNQYDGFLVYPQLVVTEGCFAGWGSAPSPNFVSILAMIDSLGKFARADIDRLLIDGLSGGGYGAWRMVDLYPQRIAKIMPSAAAGSVANRNRFVHVPIWFATGGKDLDPSPAQAQNVYTRLKEIGADIKYTLFPERGHSVWYQHWREPGFVEAMNDVHKANPLVFFQHSEFCREEDVNSKLGLTAGFYAYEWQRNGVTIASSSNGSSTIHDNASIISFTGNEITVRLYGTYRARFKRTASSPWSDWSMKPVVIKTKSVTTTEPITVDGEHSRVLPALDGSTTVPLKMADGYLNYQWYNSTADTMVAQTQVFNAPVGVYKGRYEEQFGCGTNFSSDFKVVDANGAPKPDPAANLTAVPLSQSSVRLNWTQGNGENGFEVYRATQTDGPYQFVRLLGVNIRTFTDTGLVKNTMYFYRVRAVSETGAAAGSNEATVKTLIDNEPPTAPSGLVYQISTATAVRLTWKLSTDNEKVVRYDIYVNGRKLYSAFESGFIVAHLTEKIPYTFVLKAVDAAGNVSAPSNQVTFVPAGVEAGDQPGVPSDVSAEAIAYNKITIQWADTISNEKGFEVVRSTTSTGTYVPVGTAGANQTSLTDSGLNAQTRYYYKVRAINQNGESAFSGRTNATTLAEPETPNVPPTLSGEAAANGSVSLTWEVHSDNETGFKVFKSIDGTTFTETASLPANSNAYTDSEVTGFATYYYYVVATSSAGDGEKSNTLQIRAGNNAPVISNLNNIFVRANTVVDEDFNVSDDAGDVVTVTVQNNPGFLSLINSGNGAYILRASPTPQFNGVYNIYIVARDNNNKSSADTLVVTVGDKNTRSMLVNFGDASSPAGSPPWNNWLGIPRDGSTLFNVIDETNTPTTVVVTAVTAWSGNTRLGHITGDNTGIVPDEVLMSGWTDTGEANIFTIKGLNTAKQYNLIFVGSQNEGIMAEATYATGTQAATLNARYNTTQAAALNSLRPDGAGEISVTINRGSSSPVMYLNALIIQEHEASVQLLNPDNLYAEAVDRETIKLTWTDRTNNEGATDGYELMRATDSLFSSNVEVISLPANTHAYTNTGLQKDTRYWYRVRAKAGSTYSDYSRRVNVVTPAAIVYVNFNVTIADATAPWNNLTTPPLSNFTTPELKDQSGNETSMQLTLEKEFNGEFTAGVVTGNNSGVVPDNVLAANYWLDKSQLSQFRLSGLNHGKRYSIGFVGSSSPSNWFKGNYTATYNVHDKTVYLNSWQNSSKVVYINDVEPDPDGKLMLNFSTTQDAGYGFNAGIIIHEYSYTPPAQEPDTTTNPPDTIPGGENPPPVDTIPGGENPPPVDTIPGGENPPPVDTIPGGENPPPIDTIPGGENPPPIDTIPGGENPPPIDTIPGGENPPPIDTIPGGENPPPVDTIPGGQNPPPVDTIPDLAAKPYVFPNPFTSSVQLWFYNKQETDKISIYLYDSYGRLLQRQDYGMRPAGANIISLGSITSGLRSGVYLATLKINGKAVHSVKMLKARY